MSITREIAFELLELPTSATIDEIILRYKYFALKWFPGINGQREYSEYEFQKITLAATILIDPSKNCNYIDITPDIMYALFQSIFFKKNEYNEETDSSEPDESYYEQMDLTLQEKINEADGIARKLLEEQEQEKSKAEKKRAKKNRRKQRKKLHKMEGDNQGKENSNSLLDQKGSMSEIEEDLDPRSAFVSVIAKKHKHRKNQDFRHKNEEIQLNNHSPKIKLEDESKSVIDRSKELALEGNKAASLSNFKEATDFFTQAILLDPKNNVFYGNRSYCYDRMGLYNNALEDAEESIRLCSKTPMGYFRKGRALLGLEKYTSAEKCFLTVLDLDPGCEDAEAELCECRISQIRDVGYSREQAEDAISKCNSVNQAFKYLLSGAVTDIHIDEDPTEIFISDDESDIIFASMKAKSPVVTTIPVPQVSQPYDVKLDPKNPEGHKSLWIGNVQATVTEKKLMSLFSKCGEVLSVRMVPDKFYAFINFKNTTAPGRAIQSYQGYRLEGSNLSVRYPNLPTDSLKKTIPLEKKSLAPINGNECYFWRTSGYCVHSEQCRYKHIKDHKGIDKKK